ncbi:flagellar protein FlaG [Hydrogenimonas sp.]
MEIFNAMRTQQTPPPAQQQGVTGAHQSVSQTQKAPPQKQAQEQMQQSAQKADEKKFKEELQEVVDKLNKEMDPLKTSIRFGFDDQADELYVSVIDTSNNQEIRKIPSEEALRLAAKMRELVGMIFDKKG